MSVKPYVLCASCKSFWPKVTCLSFTAEELSRGGEQVPRMPQHVFHSHHQSEIMSAALLGCHFCSILLGSMKGCTGDHRERQYNDNDPVYVSVDVLNQNDGSFLLTLFPCEQSRIHSHDQILNDFPLRLRPTKSDVGAVMVHDEYQSSCLQTSTYSKAAADFIKSWIIKCKTEHFLCGDDHLSLLRGLDQPPIWPRRLLDLLAFESPEGIRLVDVEKNLKPEYCTLSYSWGFSTPYVMTSSNLADFRREIRVKNLPRLLKDAIEIIRDLGYQYMWIDALCIMQDGHSSPAASDDWFDQAGKMNDIFGNSIVTIAASEAFDGNQKLILPRNPLSQITCRLELDSKLAYEVVPSCTAYCLRHTFDNARYHLDSRAWVFQERILAPRTVHITRNFIHLECRSELKCEAMFGNNDCHHSGAVAKADYLILFSTFGLDGLDDSAVDFFLSYWQGLVRKYSTTNLSRKSDLLVALAGLAKHVQKRSRLTWSFGLWREHLLREMLWYVRAGKGSPCRERAPSWSWASIEVRAPPVMYATGEVSSVAEIPSLPESVRGPHIIHEPGTKFSLLAEITGLPETSDFARQPPISAEESRYSVKVVSQVISGNNGPWNMTLRPGQPLHVHRNCEAIERVHPECPFHPDYELPKDIKLCSLLLAHVSGTLQRNGIPQDWTTEVGIVLTPVIGYPRRYRRVGYFHHDMQRVIHPDIRLQVPSMFEGAPIQEVEIV